jgi:hypothetical protein
MKWFSVEISKVRITTTPNSDLPIVYSLYDIRTGDIFFKLEVDVNNKNCTHFHQSLEDFESISDGLKELALTMKEDQPYSYSKYITPLFRDKKLNDILTK